MGEVLAFTPGASRRDFQAAATTCLPPLREISDLLKWAAWAALEEKDDPDAIDALHAWQAVRAAVAALETLRDTAELWHAWASSTMPDGELYTMMLEDVAQGFAPQFVRRMKG